LKATKPKGGISAAGDEFAEYRKDDKAAGDVVKRCFQETSQDFGTEDLDVHNKLFS
jgi:hypothetical protein